MSRLRHPFRAAPVLLVFATMAATLFGCGGHARVSPTPANLDPVPAPRIAGEVVVQCGHGSRDLELFSWRDGQLRRLTVAGGMDNVGAYSVRGDTVALARFGEHDGTKIELADLGRTPLEGPREGFGQMVALGPRRAVASIRVREHSSGLLWDAIYVRRDGGRSRRIAEFRTVWGQQFIGRHLTAIVSDGHTQSVARDVGTARQRLDTLRTDTVNGVPWAISRSGRVAYTNGRARNHRIRLLTAAGREERAFATSWNPLAWTPDGRRLLVTSPGEHATVGLMNPADGVVRDLGSLACGRAYDAQYRVSS